jgi:hypothetical protein
MAWGSTVRRSDWRRHRDLSAIPGDRKMAFAASLTPEGMVALVARVRRF